jgi:DNA-binding CsgD family transcriptional regulator
MQQITNREREVLYLIAHEHSSKEIANRLYVSYETVNTHRKNIMSKLAVKNTAGMIRVAFEREILTITSLSWTA